MTMDAGLHYPHRFAGLVGISGWVCEAEKALKELSPIAKQQRFLVTHGTHDPVVAFERTRKQVEWCKGRGFEHQNGTSSKPPPSPVKKSCA